MYFSPTGNFHQREYILQVQNTLRRPQIVKHLLLLLLTSPSPRFWLLTVAENVLLITAKTPSFRPQFKKNRASFAAPFLTQRQFIWSDLSVTAMAGKQSKARKPEVFGKGKVTPTQIAFIVDRYLCDNNFSSTRSTFRNEASSLISHSPIHEVSLHPFVFAACLCIFFHTFCFHRFLYRFHHLGLWFSS